jgi:hypothetical protein
MLNALANAADKRFKTVIADVNLTSLHNNGECDVASLFLVNVITLHCWFNVFSLKDTIIKYIMLSYFNELHFSFYHYDSLSPYPT